MTDEIQDGIPDPRDLNATIIAAEKDWTIEFQLAVLLSLRRIERRLAELCSHPGILGDSRQD